MLKTKFILVLLLAFGTLNALTLNDALQHSIAKDPQIKEKEDRYKEIFYDVKIAKSGYLPQVDLLSNSLLYNSTTTKAGEQSYDYEVMFKENIFNGFGDISKHKLELSKYESAYYTVKELVNSFSLSVITSYLNVLREQEMLAIQQSSIDNHENILKKIQRKYNVGMGTQLELRLSKTSLSLAKINYFEQKNSLTQAKILFEKYMDEEVDMQTLSYPNKNVVVPDSFSNALKIALKSHPSMLISKLNKQMTEHELTYTKKDLYPSLDFKTNYYGGENGIYNNLKDYYEVSLELSYNLYSGGKDLDSSGKIRQKVSQKSDLIQKSKLDITHKLRSQFDAFLMLRDKIGLLDEYVKFKELTLESYYAQFSIGKAKLRDILDTTESLYTAKKMRLNGKVDLLILKYNILEAMGQLPIIEYEKKIVKKVIVTKPKEVKKEIKKEVKAIKVEELSTSCYSVGATKLNIREKKDTSSKILGSYKFGDVVCSEEMDDIWIKSDLGWVSKTYLKYIKESDK
ncbi:MAG: hypothetical protein GQ570_05370 [Helicobacteraceae bacterium]|nr:hypothetical protein [Helicobacteraceae bacterium]